MSRQPFSNAVGRSPLLSVFLLLIVGIACSGCGEGLPPGPMPMDEQESERWEIALVEWRIEKNELFMDPQETPLPAELLQGFEGLDYYFPEPSLRFRLPLRLAAEPDTLELRKSQGETAPFLVKGEIRFRHGDQTHSLTVFSPVHDPESLWLPFYDLTNGEATYPGGRYLDLERTPEGTVEVDFNKAYNPFCVYDPESWNCVQPPPRNRLPMRVEAGEKLLVSAQP